MKHRSRILFFTLAGFLLLTFGWFVLRPREPSYQGKTLTEWLLEADDFFDYPEADPDAVNAIHHVGGNGIPTLLSYAAATKDSRLKKIILKWDDEHPHFALRATSQRIKEVLAIRGFYILGSDAQSAVPELIRLLKDDDDHVRMTAATCLASIGPAAVPAVPDLIEEFEREKRSSTNHVYFAAYALGKLGPFAQAAIPSLKSGLTNSERGCRFSSQVALINIHAISISPLLEQLKDTTNVSRWPVAMMVLLNCGTNAIPAVPLFISALNCTNGRIRSESLFALGFLHQQPHACVPAIVPLLSSKDDYLRQNAIRALRSFGKKAKPAVPELTRCLDDPNYSVRKQATNALREIDAEAAAKAGIK